MSDATITPINEAVSLRLATAQRATRAALVNAPPARHATNLALLFDQIGREAIAMGLSTRDLLEAQSRALSATVHNMTGDKDAGFAVLKSTCDLARSQLNFLHACNIERTPFARPQPETETKGNNQ